MRASGSFVAGLLAAILALAASQTVAEPHGRTGDRQTGVQLAQRPAKGPPVPFETELARLRKDRNALSFNDHIAAIPANRIRDLPVVNGRMGDRVTMGEGHVMHFPLGYLVTATYQFDTHRYASGGSTLQADPAYALVQRFDSELGPVCARTDVRSSDTRVEFRLRRGQTMAVVVDQPGRHDSATGTKSRSYLVFVGTEERYVALDQTARRLLAHCRSGAKSIDVPHDGSALNLAMMTGIGG